MPGIWLWVALRGLLSSVFCPFHVRSWGHETPETDEIAGILHDYGAYGVDEQCSHVGPGINEHEMLNAWGVANP